LRRSFCLGERKTTGREQEQEEEGEAEFNSLFVRGVEGCDIINLRKIPIGLIEQFIETARPPVPGRRGHQIKGQSCPNVADMVRRMGEKHIKDPCAERFQLLKGRGLYIDRNSMINKIYGFVKSLQMALCHSEQKRRI
jgi:hypothetical protein